MNHSKKSTFSDIFVIGFALFAMFFGAGNLIFPPYLGMTAGDKWFSGFLAFVIADGGLAFLTVLAMTRKDGTFWCVIDRIGKLPAKVLATVAILTVGPLLCIPRTCATTFEMGLLPLMPNFSSILFSILFFAIVWALTIRPSAVVDIIGKFLTPILLVILTILVIVGIISPIGEVSTTQMTESVVRDGILAGYQTMDVLVSLAVTLMLVGSATAKGYTSRKARATVITKAGFICLLGLALVYGGLTYLGATTSGLGLDANIGQAELVVFITEALLGKTGVVLLSLIVFFACLTTAVGLVSSSADFLTEIFGNKFSYTKLVVCICAFATVIANFGIGTIIRLAAPILNIIYPILLTQMLLSFFDKQIPNVNVNRFVAGAVLVMALMGVLSDFGVSCLDFVYALPFAQYGFFWLVPAIMLGIVGAFIPAKSR